MVVLTEELLHCTPVQLMSAAQLASPLEIKYFSTNKDNKNDDKNDNEDDNKKPTTDTGDDKTDTPDKDKPSSGEQPDE